jgi:hypothetical protein
VKKSGNVSACGLVGTTFFGQVTDQIIQAFEFHGTDQRRLLTPLPDYTSRLQLRDVMRQGRAGYVQLFLYLSYGEPVVTGANQQAHNPEPGRITHFGENIGSVINFHAADNKPGNQPCQRYY